MNIQKGDINVEKLYVKIVNEMVFFLKILLPFLKKLKNQFIKNYKINFGN